MQQGNNGGDGFVIARHLLNCGARVYVYVLGTEESYSPEAQAHLHTLQELADEETCLIDYFVPSDKAWDTLYRRLASSQVVIDAILGTGFHGTLRMPVSRMVNMVNEVAASGSLQVIAVDIPTGVNADTGDVSGSGDEEAAGPIFADMTVTFGVWKRGLLLYPGRTCAGLVVCDDIGMPRPLLAGREDDAAYMLEENDISEVLVPRSPDSHKGTHGTVAIVTGSSDMAEPLMTCPRRCPADGAGSFTLSACAGTYGSLLHRPSG